jgi:hypothetical protein
MKDDTQRKPQQEVFDIVEAERTDRGKDNGKQHRIGNAESVSDLRRDSRCRHRGKASHCRVQADHRRRDAALFHDDAEQRQTEADRDTNRRDGGNGSDQRWPVYFLNRRRRAGRRL